MKILSGARHHTMLWNEKREDSSDIGGPIKLASTHIITVALQKGGCTKTTSACTLAAAAALEGYSVCVVDMDRQCNATNTFIADADDLQEKGKLPSVADAFRKKAPADEIAVPIPQRFGGRLSVVPSERALDAVPYSLEAEIKIAQARPGTAHLDTHEMQQEQLSRLKKSLAALKGKVDLVFIDTPPDLGFLTTSALIAADWVLVPLTPSKYDLSGLQTFMANLAKVRRNFNPNLQLLGILLSRVKKRVLLDRQLRERLAETFKPKHLFAEDITDSAVHRQALATNTTIFEYASRSEPAVQQYLNVFHELVNRLEAPGLAEVANG
jgi:chromosome partitioning protein